MFTTSPEYLLHFRHSSSKKENDFVYHDKVPALSSLPELKGASLVKGIPFSPDDPDVSGPDIFARLVPMEAHETSSLYRYNQIIETLHIFKFCVTIFIFTE